MNLKELPEVSVAWLRSEGACERQVLRFERCFGPDAKITLDSALIEVAASFDIVWLACRLHPPVGEGSYCRFHKHAEKSRTVLECELRQIRRDFRDRVRQYLKSVAAEGRPGPSRSIP